MAADVALDHRLADRHAVVDEVQSAVPRARIVPARLVVGVRQFDQRDMFAQSHGFRRPRHARDRAREEPAAASATAAAASAFADRRRTLRRAAASAAASARRVVGERQQRFDLGVLREGLRPRYVERAAGAVDAVRAGPERTAGAVNIAEQKVRCVHEHVAVGLGSDREAPEHGLRERVLDRFALRGVRAGRSETLVALNQQDTRSDTLKHDDASLSALAAVEPDVVRAETGGKAGRQQELGVESRDLEEQRSRPLVPVDREVAVELLHAQRPLLDRLRGAAHAAARLSATASRLP